MEICFALPKDAAALYHLNVQFNGSGCASVAQVAEFLFSPHEEIILLAQNTQAAVGFCCAQLCHSFCYSRPLGLITELFVLPEYRRQGIAAALLCQAESVLSHRGAAEIQLCTAMDNCPAQQFYQACGYTPLREAIYQKQL